MSDLTPWDHLLALLAGVLLPLVGAWQHGKSPVAAQSAREKITLYWSNSAILALLAGATLLVWHLAGRPASALGLIAVQRRPGTGLALAALFLALYALDTLRQLSPSRLPVTRLRWQRDTPFMPATRREAGHSLVMVVSAALFEEVVFRGFLVAYATHFTGDSVPGRALAVALPAVVFGLCHLYQGRRAALKIALLASFFGAILVVTGSLLVPIALHFLVDLVGVLIGLRLLAGPGQTDDDPGR